MTAEMIQTMTAGAITKCPPERTPDNLFADQSTATHYGENGILSVIGNTPLVPLKRIFRESPIRLFAKLEGFNPGGSSKDRPAVNIIMRGLETGLIQANSVIIESSSGNLGVGLAQVCSYFGLRFICVVDAKTTVQNIRLLESYGAEVDVILDPDPETGEFLPARIERVKELTGSIENSFWPNQYGNPLNALSHQQTMHEIVTALGGEVDYVLCATSTCGTMRGCVEYIRAHDMTTKMIAVDAVGSVIFGGENAKRLIPGHGAALRPQLFRADLADECVHVTDLDCVVGCRLLAREEAILAGGSSGAVIMAMDKKRHAIPAGATCVLIFPDRGERYLETIYSDEWVFEHLGEVTHLWEEHGKFQHAEQ